MTNNLSKYTGVILIIGLITYIIAWLAPPYEGLDNGYDAYTNTYKLLFEIGDKMDAKNSFLDKVMIVCASISPHTNYIIVLTMLLLLFGKNSIGDVTLSFLQNLSSFCFLINLSWIYLSWNEINDLRIGYYLWAASFLIVAIAAWNVELEKTVNNKPTA